MISEEYSQDSVEYEDTCAREVAEGRVARFEYLVEVAGHWDRMRLQYLGTLCEIPTRWVNDHADKAYLSLADAEHAEWLRDKAEECRIGHSRAARALIEAEFPVEEWITCADGKTVVYIQPAKRRMNDSYHEPLVLFEEITEDSEPTDPTEGEAF